VAKPTRLGAAVLDVTEKLSRAVGRMRFQPPTEAVYNPLDYAGAMHTAYVTRFCRKKKRVVFLGMNPGPWGMAQTGVPFGEVATVREWMKLDAEVGKPKPEHPKRPIEGLACQRSEVSGARLWGLFAERFGTAEAFFDEHYVANYCPLVFMEASGKNRTPDKLPKEEREPLERACDKHLAALIELLQPEVVVGVGKFAEHKALKVIGEGGPRVTTVLHPSPASPIANRGWSPQATAQLIERGVWVA
jgi:single-strand selective monofunctional uracil DNA glycosylase